MSGRKQSPDEADRAVKSRVEEPPDLDPFEREMFDGLLRSLAVAGRDLAADATAGEAGAPSLGGEILPEGGGPKDLESPGEAESATGREFSNAVAALDAVGEPSLEQLEALEDELALDEQEDIDEEELARLFAGAADDPIAADAASMKTSEPDPLTAAQGAISAPGAGEALLAKLIGGLSKEGSLEGLDDEGLDDEDEPEPEGPQTPAQLIHAALERALKQLLDAELLELTGPKQEDLLEQMLAPCLAAPSLDAALQAALEGLVESEHVEEVYGDDGELLGILRESFESVHREAVQTLA